MASDWKNGPHRHKLLCESLLEGYIMGAEIHNRIPRPIHPDAAHQVTDDEARQPFKTFALCNAANFAVIAATCGSVMNTSMAKFTTTVYVGRRPSTVGVRWHIVG